MQGVEDAEEDLFTNMLGSEVFDLDEPLLLVADAAQRSMQQLGNSSAGDALRLPASMVDSRVVNGLDTATVDAIADVIASDAIV